MRNIRTIHFTDSLVTRINKHAAGGGSRRRRFDGDGRPNSLYVGDVYGIGQSRLPPIDVDDEPVIPLNAVLPLPARLGMVLTGGDSIFGLLQNWEFRLHPEFLPNDDTKADLGWE
jgi:hypothetical protein